jgi:hypothetical protein
LSHICRRKDGFCRKFGLFYYIRVLTVLVDFPLLIGGSVGPDDSPTSRSVEGEHLAGLRTRTREMYRIIAKNFGKLVEITKP